MKKRKNWLLYFGLFLILWPFVPIYSAIMATLMPNTLPDVERENKPSGV